MLSILKVAMQLFLLVTDKNFRFLECSKILNLVHGRRNNAKGLGRKLESVSKTSVVELCLTVFFPR